MEYRFDDRALHAEEFLRFVNRVWPGDYDPARTEEALVRTICLTARDNGTLVGCLRILTDGYFFGTITELLVLPGIPAPGNRQCASGAGKTAYPDPALFWSPARGRAVL